jgi:hypothetical protein
MKGVNVMNKADDKIGSMVLSKTDQHIIRNLTSLKFMGLYLALVGVVGVLIGLYTTIYKPMSSCSTYLTRALIAAAIAFISTGWYLYNIARLVKKLREQFNSKSEMQ